MKASIQMYSLRDYIQKDGLDTVLAKISDAGFDGVETAGFYGMTPSDFKTHLDKYNLKVSSIHMGTDEIISRGVEAAEVLQTNMLVVPYLNFSDLTQMDFHIDKFKKAKAVCDGANLALAYHNHSQEFYCGRDCILELVNAVPGLKVELDIYWLALGGRAFKEYHPIHKDKYFSFHIKELSCSGADGCSPLPGEGFSFCNDAREIAKNYGFEWLIFEFERINISYGEYLRRAAEFLKG